MDISDYAKPPELLYLITGNEKYCSFCIKFCVFDITKKIYPKNISRLSHIHSLPDNNFREH